MQAIDVLVVPRWLVPIEPAGLVLEAHALAVDGGRIIAVLPVAEARERFQPAEIRDLPGHALMPGLVNLHTHSGMSLLRGVADDLALLDWLQNHIWPAESANVNATFCEDGVRLAAAEMIRSGTTCFNDMYYFPDATARVAREAGMRAVIGLIVLDFPTPWAQPGEYLPKALELHDTLKHEPLIRTVFAPHAPYTVSDAPLREIRKFADVLDIGIHMHLHETAREVEDAVSRDGRRPWRRLQGLGLPGPDFIAVHMTQLSPWEIAEAAEYGLHIAHCPESNLKLASGFCPVQKLAEAGVNVGIGTDGAASNNDLDLFAELRTAALLAKAVSGDPRALPAASALAMATINGARALGLDHQIGTLAAGKSADFIAVDLSALNTQPVYHVLSQLAYAVNSRQVSDVYVAGRALLRDGALTTLDPEAVTARAQEWRARIQP